MEEEGGIEDTEAEEGSVDCESLRLMTSESRFEFGRRVDCDPLRVMTSESRFKFCGRVDCESLRVITSESRFEFDGRVDCESLRVMASESRFDFDCFHVVKMRDTSARVASATVGAEVSLSGLLRRMFCMNSQSLKICENLC